MEKRLYVNNFIDVYVERIFWLHWVECTLLFKLTLPVPFENMTDRKTLNT